MVLELRRLERALVVISLSGRFFALPGFENSVSSCFWNLLVAPFGARGAYGNSGREISYESPRVGRTEILVVESLMSRPM